MRDEELRAAVAAGGEAWRVCEAARAWVRGVRAAEREDPALAETLAPLAGHASPEVRQEVAEAVDLFPEAAFTRVVALLADDANHYVATAAARAAKRRAARRKERARTDEDLAAMAGLLREIEGAPRYKVRRLAERLVQRGRDLFTRRLHHELAKAHSGLEIALEGLNEELGKARLDRARLRELAGVARARQRHLWSIAERARATTATMTPTFRREILAPIVEEARGQLVERIGERAAKLAMRIDVPADLALDADRGALLQALGNVLQNAVEAYAAGAERIEIEVGARTLQAASLVELTVGDRGAGMSPAVAREIFVPFGSRKPGGTGVGMIIVRKMIEEVHGGTLTLESAPGEGTRVMMVMPREQGT